MLAAVCVACNRAEEAEIRLSTKAANDMGILFSRIAIRHDIENLEVLTKLVPEDRSIGLTRLFLGGDDGSHVAKHCFDWNGNEYQVRRENRDLLIWSAGMNRVNDNGAGDDFGFRWNYLDGYADPKPLK